MICQEREPDAVQEVAIDLAPPDCCQALAFVAGVIALVGVEAPAAACDHVFLAVCVCLAEHRAEAHVAEVDVQKNGLAGVETLERLAGLADLGTEVVDGGRLSCSPLPWCVLLEQSLHRLSTSAEPLTETAVISEHAQHA